MKRAFLLPWPWPAPSYPTMLLRLYLQHARFGTEHACLLCLGSCPMVCVSSAIQIPPYHWLGSIPLNGCRSYRKNNAQRLLRLCSSGNDISVCTAVGKEKCKLRKVCNMCNIQQQRGERSVHCGRSPWREGVPTRLRSDAHRYHRVKSRMLRVDWKQLEGKVDIVCRRRRRHREAHKEKARLCTLQGRGSIVLVKPVFSLFLFFSNVSAFVYLSRIGILYWSQCKARILRDRARS